MPRLDYRALRALIPIRVVLEQLHYVPLQIRRDQGRGPCPLHRSQDTSDCFSVQVRKHVFFYHGCHRGGNQLDLWATAIKLPLYHASLNLCHRLNLVPPLLSAPRNQKNSPS